MTSDDDRFSGSMAALLAGPSLDLDAREQIVARGDAMVPRLLEVLQDRRLAEADAPGDGYAPLHAAELLAEIRATDAIAPMLALFAALDHDDMLFEAIAVVLSDFGAAVVEPVLAAHDATEDPELRDYYCEILAKCGERDERIFPRLLGAYERIPEFGTGLLGTYGDPAGLPWVQREFERVADASDNDGIAALLGAEEALASLDALTPEHEDIVARARQRALELRGKPLRPLVPAARVLPARRRERPGRNEPCWCGSGKKYKRCHADADERDERSALDEELAGEDAELAQALIDLGGDDLDDFVEGEEEARQRLVDLLMIAWNIASFEEIGNERGPQQLRAELDRADDPETLHEYVDDLVEQRREEWPEDTRFVMSARVVEDTLVVESGEHDPEAKPTLH